MIYKNRLFLHKKQFWYKNVFCKNIQKYIFVKKQYFYNRLICKKAAFLQKYIFVKKQYFYNRSICKKAAFLHKNDAFLQGPYLYATLYISNY